ncbi:MAG: cytochrome c [Rhodoferax sp.]|nr:cytochrome c [Rhodoferax sp.]
MKQVKPPLAGFLTLLTLLSSASLAQGRVDFGKQEFESSCASCHGVSGKGDGALFPYLVKPPSDLTTLSRRNGGVFPSKRVWDTIDGTVAAEIGAHGTREMPIWGQVYQDRAQQTPYEPNWYAAHRMGSLIYYLARIQEP